MVRIPEGCGGCIEQQFKGVLDIAGSPGAVAKVVCPLVVALTLSPEVSSTSVISFLEQEAEVCTGTPAAERPCRQRPDGPRAAQMLGYISTQSRQMNTAESPVLQVVHADVPAAA